MPSGNGRTGGGGKKAGSGKQTSVKERQVRQLAKLREAGAGALF